MKAINENILDLNILREIEQRILNYMLLSKENFFKIEERVNENDFIFDMHKLVYRNILLMKTEASSGILFKKLDFHLLISAYMFERFHNLDKSLFQDIMSQPPSSDIESDLELLNSIVMEREIALHNNKIQIFGEIETQEKMTKIIYINGILVGIDTMDVMKLPSELYYHFEDVLQEISKMNSEDENYRVLMAFSEDDEEKDIQAFHILKGVEEHIEWFENICKWADSYQLDEKIFPRDRCRLQDLLTLNLTGQNIYELPKEIIELKSLHTLFVNNNHLNTIIDEVYQLKNLSTLSFMGNNISEISEDIIKLKKLTTFSACNNNIALLPKSFYKLQQLSSICLHNNNITDLAEEMGNFESLTLLAVSNNNIKRLPQSISNLSKLKSLHIENTQITCIDEKLFKNTTISNLAIDDNLLPAIIENIEYLTANTINLTHSDFNNSSSIFEKIDFQFEDEKWMKDEDKQEHGCVKLSRIVSIP